jgi:hypothetical protein
LPMHIWTSEQGFNGETYGRTDGEYN